MSHRASAIKNIPAVTAGVVLAALVSTQPAFADQARDDTIAACAEAATLLEANDIDAALEEAEWCREGLQQLKQAQTLAIFPDSVAGYVGGQVKNEGAMGITSLGRTYKKDGNSIELELVTGAVASRHQYPGKRRSSSYESFQSQSLMMRWQTKFKAFLQLSNSSS